MEQKDKLKEMIHEENEWYENEAEETCYDYSSFLSVSARIETIHGRMIFYSEMYVSYQQIENILETISHDLQSRIEHISPHIQVLENLKLMLN